MTILYTQIIKLPEIQLLACAYSKHGSIIEPDKKILKELRNLIIDIPDKSSSTPYSYNCTDKTHKIFINIKNDLLYATITDLNSSSSTIQRYVEEVSSNFETVYKGEGINYIAFEKVLKQLSERFNNKSDLMEVDEELKKTRGTCVESLNSILKRGEKIDKLAELADKLDKASKELKRNTRDMYFENVMSQYFTYAIVVLVLFIILYIFVLR
ncbi:Protein transport protein SEC22 [Astathelohania contejeani]|uniref:Protein transport protein SEC22 n=1 Tax=Astathelohania contejeani TaxID=164912 RepID=A0ABQ7HZL0_9MICR|nr:Protein transport protein SEC22 [Thelohania contejeani]